MLRHVCMMVRPIRKYGVFSGRAREQEFWLFYLFYMLVLFITTRIDLMVFAMNYPQGPITFFSLVATLVLWLPLIAVSARRLHDMDRGGWWMMALIIPVVAPWVLWLCVILSPRETLAWMLVCTIVFWAGFGQKGTKGDNRFGPDPKSPIKPVT